MSKEVKIFWLFGRSAAGKTTLARRLHQKLLDRKVPVLYLDGDELRSGLNADLGFTDEARLENHRRIAEIAQLAAAQGFNLVVSTMATHESHRDVVQKILGVKLVWLYIHAPLEVCIRRDPKGLYRKAKTGQVTQLLDYPFDLPRPHEQENYIDTVALSIEDCCESVLGIIDRHLSPGEI
jgi:adenylyl-sulfate kinase